jgi:micrococcal nuclease
LPLDRDAALAGGGCAARRRLARVSRAVVIWLVVTCALVGCLAPAPPPTPLPAPTDTPSGVPTVRRPTLVAPTATPAVAAPTRTPGVGEWAWVSEVIDGDTIRVELEGGKVETVRYIGINTPETNHPTVGSEPFGPEANEANRALVEGRRVFLERDRSETDRYGRLLRYVWVGDLLVNAELVRQGYARSIRYPPDTAHQTLLDQLQREAQRAGRGLWEAANAAPRFADVRITAKEKAAEPEYVTLTNEGNQPVDLGGWTLYSVRGGQRYELPAGVVLQPGASVTIYSGPGAEQAGGLFWTGANVWNRSQSDPAELYDAAGALVDRW